MTARVVQVDATHPDPEVVGAAARILLAGGLVAMPTETVYGLAGLADREDSLARIFAAKGRPASHPLIAHVPDLPAARRIAGAWPPLATRLAAEFWPGPLTLVVPRGPSIPRMLTAGLDTMAVRAPDHAVALALLHAVGHPLAAPSANPYQRVSPTTAAHVLEGLGERVDLILDAGPCRLGIESTIVDVTSDPPRILRLGSLGLDQLHAVVPDLLAEPPRAGSHPAPAPGMAARHYAPRARLRIVRRAALAELLAALQPEERPAAVLAFGRAPRLAAEVRALPQDPERYGRQLFAVLHELDALQVRTVLVEEPPDDTAWAAIRDRLRRASAAE